MNSDGQKSKPQSTDSKENAIGSAFSSVIIWLQGVVGSIYRTTLRFIKNIPSRLHNKYLRYMNERRRMPRRKTKSKVYVLVGYTSKEHVDRRFMAMKVQNLIRKSLLLGILIVFLIIIFKWLDPLGNINELKQIVGIDSMDDLAQEDPFGSVDPDTSNVQFNIAASPTPVDS